MNFTENLHLLTHQKVTNGSIRQRLNKQRLSSTPFDIKSWHFGAVVAFWAYLPHAEQSTTKECAIWLYGMEEDSQSGGWTTSLSGLVW